MILFVGPLPPPVHGFSVINAAMLARFQAVSPVAVFNRAAAAQGGALASIAALMAGLGRLLEFLVTLLRQRAVSSAYIALSGGLGQLKDWPYLLAARLLRRPVVLHHHSFAYLRRAPWHARLVLGSARQAQHIVLCDCMAAALADTYRVPRQRIAVLSNAAFLDPAADEPARQALVGPLRIGFLSNITAEKGIWAFFELGDALVMRGVALQALVAGPPAAAIAERFAREAAARPWCRALGAVHGADKVRFFAEIDVLVFPTFYVNEAEPVTILEALRAGVPVVANARGCIADMLPAAAGTVFEGDAQFVRLATDELQAWSGDTPPARQARHLAASQAFAALHAEHSRRAGRLVSQVLAMASDAAGADLGADTGGRGGRA